MKYGLCRVCREPRRAAMTDEMVDGKRVVTHGLVCPNGCQQEDYLLESDVRR
jgi:hypothetical protein